MNANFMIIECQEGHRFRHGLTDDGYSKCPRCDSLLGVPYYAPKEQVQQLPRINQAWRERTKHSSYRAQCLTCDYEGSVSVEKKEDYQEVVECPKCGGDFVDIWHIFKYKKDDGAKQAFQNSVDVNMEKMQLKLRAIAKHTTALADELDAIDNLDEVKQK